MTEGVIPDYQKDPNPYQNPGAGGPAEREAIALERIAETLDNIAAMLASQRVPAGSASRVSDEKWIEWSGGKCPVPLEELVDVKLRNGVFQTGASPYALDWWNDGDDYDIIAYRIHKTQEGKTE